MEETFSPGVNITGKRIALGPLRRDVMLELDLQWSNDFAVTSMHGQPSGPVTAEMAAARYERIMQAEAERWFLIYERSSGRPIGTTSLSQIRPMYRTAEFNISIGAQDCWGKGYGTETTRLMLRYAFATLGLNMVWLRVLSANAGGMRAYQRAGFREAGRLREAQWLGQQAYDLVYMDCIAREFLAADAPQA